MLTNLLNLFREPKFLLTSRLCPLWVVPNSSSDLETSLRPTVWGCSWSPPALRAGQGRAQTKPAQGTFHPPENQLPGGTCTVQEHTCRYIAICGWQWQLSLSCWVAQAHSYAHIRGLWVCFVHTNVSEVWPLLTYPSKLSCKRVYSALDRNILLHPLNYGHFLLQEPPAPPAL